LATMSALLTPPSTNHRANKENLRPFGARVAWAEQKLWQYHSLTQSPPHPLTHNSNNIPSRSILKKTQSILPFEEEHQREVTPEPSSPLQDAQYLVRPIDAIIQLDASLHELIEAYSVLAARLRATIANANEAASGCPLLQPLIRHRDIFVDALSRDLGRALVDPMSSVDKTGLLPSPKPSPTGKRSGMSGEQVKYARDLCTTTHAVIKLLAVILTIPAVYSVFTGAHILD
jgi:hypothetical protein